MDNYTTKKLCAVSLAFVTGFVFLTNLFVLANANDPATLLMGLKFSKLGDDKKVQFADYFRIVPDMNVAQFYRDFRMTKSQFYLLHEKLMYSEAFTCKGTGTVPIDSRKCLFIGLWVLATPDCYRSIASRFNVTKSTVVTCVRKVIDGLLSDVCHNAIKMPKSENERRVISREFQKIAGMRGVLGAIDCCHIEIPAPIGRNKSSYFDRNKNYSIVLQAVCDADLFFIDVDVKWPGSVHDARALRTSDLYANANNIFLNNYYLIGDPAYPLKSRLMIPYKKRHRLNRERKKYNQTLSRTRQVIERAFGMLKQKFRRLYHLPILNIKTTVKAVVACYILHNISLAADDYAEQLIFGAENERAQNDARVHFFNNVNTKAKRQVICDEIWQLYLRQRGQVFHNL